MAEDLNEFDTVVLAVDLPDEGLTAGEVGTVVLVHSSEAVEVEFCDDQGRTYALLGIPVSKLRHYRPSDSR